MTIQSLGGVSIGGVNPAAYNSALAVTASVGVTLPSLQAQLAGAISAQLAITLNPPSLVTQLSAAVDLVAQLTAAIAVGVPSVDVQLTSMATMIAELQVSIGSLEAQLTITAGVLDSLTLGVEAWTFDGTCGSLGSELQAVTSGGFQGGISESPANALIIATTSPASWSAIKTVFGV